MGRVITISLDETAYDELKKGFEKSESHRFRSRCQIVLLKSEGHKSKEIAEFLGFCEPMVNSWLKRYLVGGIQALKTRAGQGRKAILEVERDVAAVRLSVSNHRQKLSQAKVELENSLQKRFSEKTLRRFLKNLAVDINESENDPGVRKMKNF
jgi:transposase